ncbi:MAK10-like protein [Tanacetum coccineum]|uniref:MAK10-like protein n=1 Tax=Tanacetum coccineum TaxID=301880 RepID=A0ABQ5GMR1_9ASTR
MGDENPIRTLGDYSKPSHKGYRNTIELPAGNNVVPLRSDTIRLVQNGCLFHGLRSEDPNLKDFLKLVDSLDLDGSITTWEDLTTRFLAQFFLPGRTAKLCNDILIFQQHHGESLSEAWTRLSPQPQSLGTNFEAQVRDYMVAYIERMERFENAIFKQREEINGRMTEMFGLLKELTTSRTPKKVLIREEAKFPVSKNVNSISPLKEEEERSNKTEVTPDNTKKPSETKTEMPVREAEAMNRAKNGVKNESIKTPENDEAVEASRSQPVAYYLKHKINENLINGLITKKEDIEGNFEIPCSIGDLKHMNALVDQESDVNVMHYSTYMRLTDERPAETDIRLSLAGHSYIYPLGIDEDVLVEVDEHVFPEDFVILDIKENEKRPFIFGTSFLTIAKAKIKFDTCTITLRLGKCKVSFHRISDSSYITDKGVKNDIEPIAPIMTVNRLVLEWEERIKLQLEKEMKFNQWRSNNFKNKQPAPVKVKGGIDDEGEVT